MHMHVHQRGTGFRKMPLEVLVSEEKHITPNTRIQNNNETTL